MSQNERRETCTPSLAQVQQCCATTTYTGDALSPPLPAEPDPRLGLGNALVRENEHLRSWYLGASAPELKPVNTGKAPIPKVSSEEMEKINAMIKAKGTVNPHKEATFQRKFHNRGAVHGEKHREATLSCWRQQLELHRVLALRLSLNPIGFVANQGGRTAAKMSRTAAELRRSMTGGRSSMRMSAAENRKSGVDGAYHVEKPRHHHVHMSVHMPHVLMHVHMPHVHMPHLHNPFPSQDSPRWRV